MATTTAAPQHPMTAIVAATLSNGIGKDGGLPWRLPSEMKYFARVTSGPPSSSTSTPNAVIMGRKTWESIPIKFRPLPNRLNLVISRTEPDLSSYPATTCHCSLTSALCSIPSTTPKTFLIGGAQLYNLALNPPSDLTDTHAASDSAPIPTSKPLSTKPPLVDRVLLTRILEPDFDCDTFLPDFTASPGWARSSLEQLQEYIGFEVPGEDGVVQEKGIKYRFELWTRKG